MGLDSAEQEGALAAEGTVSGEPQEDLAREGGGSAAAEAVEGRGRVRLERHRA